MACMAAGLVKDAQRLRGLEVNDHIEFGGSATG